MEQWVTGLGTARLPEVHSGKWAPIIGGIVRLMPLNLSRVAINGLLCTLFGSSAEDIPWVNANKTECHKQNTSSKYFVVSSKQRAIFVVAWQLKPWQFKGQAMHSLNRLKKDYMAKHICAVEVMREVCKNQPDWSRQGVLCWCAVVMTWLRAEIIFTSAVSFFPV